METLHTACLLWLSVTLLVGCDQVVLGEDVVLCQRVLVGVVWRSVTACVHYLS